MRGTEDAADSFAELRRYGVSHPYVREMPQTPLATLVDSTVEAGRRYHNALVYIQSLIVRGLSLGPAMTAAKADLADAQSKLESRLRAVSEQLFEQEEGKKSNG